MRLLLLTAVLTFFLVLALLHLGAYLAWGTWGLR